MTPHLTYLDLVDVPRPQVDTHWAALARTALPGLALLVLPSGALVVVIGGGRAGGRRGERVGLEGDRAQSVGSEDGSVGEEGALFGARLVVDRIEERAVKLRTMHDHLCVRMYTTGKRLRRTVRGRPSSMRKPADLNDSLTSSASASINTGSTYLDCYRDAPAIAFKRSVSTPSCGGPTHMTFARSPLLRPCMMSIAPSSTCNFSPARRSSMYGFKLSRWEIAPASVGFSSADACCGASEAEATSDPLRDLAKDMTPRVRWSLRGGTTMLGSSPSMAGSAARSASVNADTLFWSPGWCPYTRKR